ncbi:MAG TPA: aminotransferase class V-fold PLP-dependent enzyme [Patescibacteria group bacterium]|nr:aminotransferase class V-fold PLP-dependent enzyme [Patescibacteria group bacterium]
MKKVYLDYAATTPVRPEVVEAMCPYWTEKFGNPSSIHSWGREAREAVEQARAAVAAVLGAEPREVIFTSSVTTSDNLAILGVARAAGKGHLITSQIEHHAALDVFHVLEKGGFAVIYLPVGPTGIVDLKALESAIRSETILVSVMWANNEVGTVEPLEEIVKIVKAQNPKTHVHTDAATIVEYLPINAKKLGVDLLSLGAHKFGGPKGVGILYLKKGTKIDPITYGGHHEEGLWPGTEPTPLIIGAAKALELAQLEVRSSKFKVTRLRDKLIKGVLEKIPEAFLTGDPVKRLPDIASFRFNGAEGEAILLRLDAEGIAASSGSACTSGELKPSHVLSAMGIKPEETHGSVRFSLGRGTTEEEIDYVLEKLPLIIKELRAIAPQLCVETEELP